MSYHSQSSETSDSLASFENVIIDDDQALGEDQVGNDEEEYQQDGMFKEVIDDLEANKEKVEEQVRFYS